MLPYLEQKHKNIKMLKFYKLALALFAILVLVSLASGYVCVKGILLESVLVPARHSAYPWEVELELDSVQGGRSSIQASDNEQSLNMEFEISTAIEYAFASAAIAFYNQKGERQFHDFSRYDRLSFDVRCDPSNTLLFTIHTIQDNFTRLDDFETYRIPTTYFSCQDRWSRVELDLTRLETPLWWFAKYNLDISRQEYRLDRVPKITFGSSFQSPQEMLSKVQLDDITLHGRDWRYAYFYVAFLVLIWGGFATWFVRQSMKSLVEELKEKLQKDRPLVAYQQLSIEPQRDKDKAAVLRFMATEYANEDVNLEHLVQKLGVNRAKINDVLKDEMGYTFSAYLNKLRLTEAARLLSEKEEANVSEIAYSVGYKSVPYFNKLFKTEYGCTPKVFKSACREQTH